jgi:hypothetical protein
MTLVQICRPLPPPWTVGWSIHRQARPPIQWSKGHPIHGGSMGFEWNFRWDLPSRSHWKMVVWWISDPEIIEHVRFWRKFNTVETWNHGETKYVQVSCIFAVSPILGHHANPTVDGRNPAPVDRWFIPLFIGVQPSKVVQDFFHPQ